MGIPHNKPRRAPSVYMVPDRPTKVALGGMTVAILSQTTNSLPVALEAGMLTVGAIVALVGGVLVGLGSRRRPAAVPVNAGS